MVARHEYPAKNSTGISFQHIVDMTLENIKIHLSTFKYATVCYLWTVYSTHFFFKSAYFGIVTSSNVYRMDGHANLMYLVTYLCFVCRGKRTEVLGI